MSFQALAKKYFQQLNSMSLNDIALFTKSCIMLHLLTLISCQRKLSLFE